MDFVIINVKSDTNVFGYLLNNIHAQNVLVNPSRSQVRRLLSESNNDILFYGHGDDGGLYNTASNGYIISSRDVQQLRTRNVIGLWCYAGNFADKYNLHGFFTSMFISNIDEANFLQVTGDPDKIFKENIKFNSIINRLIRNKMPYSQWIDYIQAEATPNDAVVRYNYEALGYYE